MKLKNSHQSDSEAIGRNQSNHVETSWTASWKRAFRRRTWREQKFTVFRWSRGCGSRGLIQSSVALIRAYDSAHGKQGVICKASLHNDSRRRGKGRTRFTTRARTRERLAGARWTVTRWRPLALEPPPLGNPSSSPCSTYLLKRLSDA